MSITDKYNERVNKVNSLLCVGLDSDLDKIPSEFHDLQSPQFEFNKHIIEETAEYVSAFKPNMAFYEANGNEGWYELKQTMKYLKVKHPDILTICDAKRADISSTNNGYVSAIFDWFGFDAVTLNPYLGEEAIMPFLERADKGCIILCRTSNPGAGEFQDLVNDGQPVWLHVAKSVSQKWNSRRNCMLVVGATYPEELKKVREAVGDMTLLVPGIGAQGGDVEGTIKAGLTKEKMGLIINSSRGIIFAQNPGNEAKKLRDEINKYR